MIFFLIYLSATVLPDCQLLAFLYSRVMFLRCSLIKDLYNLLFEVVSQQFAQSPLTLHNLYCLELSFDTRGVFPTHFYKVIRIFPAFAVLFS